MSKIAYHSQRCLGLSFCHQRRVKHFAHSSERLATFTQATETLEQLLP